MVCNQNLVIFIKVEVDSSYNEVKNIYEINIGKIIDIEIKEEYVICEGNDILGCIINYDGSGNGQNLLI